MKSTRLTLVANATNPSKTKEDSTRIGVTNTRPFKKPRIDWITVWIMASLIGGAILFVMAMRVIASS